MLRPRADFYRAAHPGPADVLLIGEVADSSVAYDRHIKLPLYARAGIGELWLVDLDQGCLEVHRHPQPASDDFRDIRRLHQGAVALQAFAHGSIDVAELLA